MSDYNATRLSFWVRRLREGDPAARDRLIEAACDRLRAMTRDLLRGDRVRRWEETDDVLQDSLVTLRKSLADARPQSSREFLSLAALHIRRSLIGYARRHFGPHGWAANHDSPAPTDSITRLELLRADRNDSPEQAAERAEQLVILYEAVAELPRELREVTELIWLHELTRVEVAEMLGVDERTVRRRWQRARLALHDKLRESKRASDVEPRGEADHCA